MLKKISAALLAVSVIAAPALAANAGKTVQPPAAKTAQAPAVKGGEVKSGTLNANAKMNHHHQYRHQHHKKVSALKARTKTGFKTPAIKKTHAARVQTDKIQTNKSHSKVSFKHAAAAKRG